MTCADRCSAPATPGLAWTDPRRGAALFIVLMFSALLAALAGAAMRTGVSGARAASVFADAARADALGEAAGDIVVDELMKGDAATHRGGALAVRVPGAEMVIDYVSESARIDVNTASVELIAAVLSAAGAEPQLTASVVEHLETLRAASGVAHGTARAASSAAAQPGASGRPRISPAYSATREATADWGLPGDVARRVLPVLTVASGSKGVDPILADRFIVSALMGGDDTRTDDYLERRGQGFINSDSALALLPVPSRPLVDFEDVPSVRAIAHVTVARRFERSYEIVVASPTGTAQAPVVVEWRKLL